MRQVRAADEVVWYYDTKSKTYNETFDTLYFKIYDVITWKYLDPYVPTNSDALVLDAGGGTGRWSFRMARKGCKVVLMDISEKMLEIATKRARKEGLQHKIIIKRGDITKTSYADESFDMILCEHALFLFKDPDILLKELRRVLKKKARLIISAPNRYVQSLVSLPEKPALSNMDNAIDILFRKKHRTMTKQGKVKIYTWTPNEFRKMLERNGFQVEKIVGKCVTMPLRISPKLYTTKKYPKDLFNDILKFELALCEKPDALSLAGHLQAIVCKQPLENRTKSASGYWF
ncbi:MAG: methyltransferase domain-containing protein [Thermoproteota archaeon]|nr:methyltransferase domain-containing protein [Thermoproteota archaeon]